MSDGRRNNGGHSTKGKAGRPSKLDEEKLIQRLKKFDSVAEKCMVNGIKDGNYQFWNKFMEYRFGKPKERVDVTSGDEQINIPIINFVKSES